MGRFGSDPRAFFEAVYKDTAPWDVGGPQPAMSSLFEAYPPLSPALDVGCGSGDLAIALAKLGLEVTGIDFVESAISQAREKIGRLPSGQARLLDFRVMDALKPSLVQRRFSSVVDSGFYHLFDPAECDQFVDELAQTLIPGGRYYLLAFDIDFGMSGLPRQVSADEVRARFTSARGWQILELRSAEFLSRVAPPVPAVGACIERLSA